MFIYLWDSYITQEWEARNQSANQKDEALKGACTLFLGMCIDFIFSKS